MKKYVLVLIPLVLGLVLALWWQSGLVPNHILYLRADFGTLFILAGLVATGIVALAVGIWTWNQRHADAVFAQVRLEQAHVHWRFIRRLDHEIKNPVTAIRAALANLEVQDNETSLASVRTQVNRLARLSADLRKLTDLETRPIEQESVNLGSLLNELVTSARERPEATQCELHLVLPQAPWPLPPITGDRDLISLAIHNLLDNALKFCSAGDTIEVRAFEDGPSVVIEVADTGPGVSDEDLQHLGEELYRGSAAASIPGSGLGLALVRAIVMRHKGLMRIRSRIGQGTVVTLRFPSTHVVKFTTERTEDTGKQ